MAVAVPGLDFSVLTVDEQLRALVLSDLATALHGVSLPIKSLGRALRTRSPDSPSLRMRDNVLVSLRCHGTLSAQRDCCSISCEEEERDADMASLVRGSKLLRT